MASKLPSKDECPHQATVTFNISVHKILDDGSLDPLPVREQELKKFGINTKAVLVLDGYDKANCIAKVKEKLEKLNG